MNYDKLNDINIENYIWVIYIVIIFMSWYSNSLEKKYFLYGDYNCKKEYRSDSINKIKLTGLSAIGSLLIVISGLIFLYIAYMDNDIDVEIAFN